MGGLLLCMGPPILGSVTGGTLPKHVLVQCRTSRRQRRHLPPRRSATVRLSDPANNTLAETAWTDEAAGSQVCH
jgi:hypothetical protein